MEKSEKLDIKLESNETEQVEKRKKKKVKRYCSVPQCGKKNNGSLHGFPRHSALRKKWIKACRLTKVVTNSMSVCNDHFLSTDFIPRWDRQLKRLKSIAIPSQNLPGKQFSKILNPDQRKKAEERAERAAKRLKREDPRYEMIMATKEKVTDKNNKLISSENSDSKVDVQPKLETGNLTENIANAPKLNVNDIAKRRKLITVQSKPSIINPNIDHNYSNVECKCNKNELNKSNLLDSSEIRAAKVLVELNERAYELIKNGEINFAIKDVILKVGEEFYHATRRYYKTTITSLIKNDCQLYFYTGIDTQLLNDLEKAMIMREEDLSVKYEQKLTDRIVLCCMKLRLNLSFSSLGSLFYLNEETCQNIFYSTIPNLKVILRSAIYWPTREDFLQNTSETFEDLKKTVTILDRSEIKIEQSICLQCRLPYVLINDNCEYLNFFLGLAKCGLITYVSSAVHGHTPNKTITDEPYISQVLVPSRDATMTDGFFIEEACNQIFIERIKKRKEKPFCPKTVIKSQPKTVDETDIDKTFKQFKMFKIFQAVIPFEMVQYVDDINVIICGIINLSNPTIVNYQF